MSTDQGASPTQVLLGAARSNNLDLLRQCLSPSSSPSSSSADTTSPPPDVNATDSLGNTALHHTARYGCLECLDYLLDRDGIDLDVRNKIDGDTPLHLAVRASHQDPEVSLEIVEFLIDAGANTQLKNKRGDLPVDLAPPTNQKMKDALIKADLAEMMTGDVVSLDDLDEDVVSGGESD